MRMRNCPDEESLATSPAIMIATKAAAPTIHIVRLAPARMSA